MRMRLKYVIGGALVSLATLTAAGGANALVITELNAAGMGVESGVVAIPAGDPLGSANWVGTTLINEGGAATGGDTVIVTGPVGAATATWTSGVDDFTPSPPPGEIETFTCLAAVPGTLCTAAGTSVPSIVLTIVSTLEPSTTPTGAPEPASLALLGSALVGFGLIRRRRKA